MCRKYIIGLRAGVCICVCARVLERICFAGIWRCALSQRDSKLVGILFSPHVCTCTRMHTHAHIQDRKRNGIYMHHFFPSFFCHARRARCTICAAVPLACSIWILWIACWNPFVRLCDTLIRKYACAKYSTIGWRIYADYHMNCLSRVPFSAECLLHWPKCSIVIPWNSRLRTHFALKLNVLINVWQMATEVFSTS